MQGTNNIVTNKNMAGKYLTFMLCGEYFAMPIMFVREINGMLPITPIPQLPAFMKGVINLRGKIVPVVDLRSKLGLEKAEATRETCIIVVDIDAIQIGAIVDSVRDVIEFRAEQIEDPPTLGKHSDKPFVSGIGKSEKRVVLLVDPDSILSRDQLAEVSTGQAKTLSGMVAS